MALLLGQIQDIEAQLSRSYQEETDGRGLTFLEWQDWRGAAIAARAKKLARYRFPKRWTAKQRGALSDMSVRQLVQDLCDLVEDLDEPVGQGLSPGQRMVLADARQWLGTIRGVEA